MSQGGRDATAALRCPRCRAALGRPTCARCGTTFVEAGHVLCLSDPEELRREQREMLSPAWRPTDQTSLEEACATASAADPASRVFRERVLEAVFALAHYPERCGEPALERELIGNLASIATLAGWIDRHRPPDRAPIAAALDVGCGPARLTYELSSRFAEGAVGLDVRVGMLRLAEDLFARGEALLPWCPGGRTFAPLRVCLPRPVQAPILLRQGSLDVAPFDPGTFALVAAVSFLDVQPDPLRALEALHALVAPGGLLLVATPYHWHADSTPPDRWLTAPERQIRSWLYDRGCDVLEEDPALPWVVPSHARLVHRYVLHALLARTARPRLDEA